MDNQSKLEYEAQQKGLKTIKYGNPGIRTDVWRKMMGLYGEAVGTFIGLNMDIMVQMLNQGFVTPLQKFQKSAQLNLNDAQNFNNKENFNKESLRENLPHPEVTKDYRYKQVKIE